MAELLGIMIGDGCLSRTGKKYIIYISGNKYKDFDYHNITTRKLFKDVFDKEIKIGFRKKENTLFIRFSDKAIFHFMTDKGVPIGKKYDGLKIPECVEGR